MNWFIRLSTPPCPHLYPKWRHRRRRGFKRRNDLTCRIYCLKECEEKACWHDEKGREERRDGKLREGDMLFKEIARERRADVKVCRKNVIKKARKWVKLDKKM